MIWVVVGYRNGVDREAGRRVLCNGDVKVLGPSFTLGVDPLVFVCKDVLSNVEPSVL
jgi:hypothetical protein